VIIVTIQTNLAFKRMNIFLRGRLRQVSEQKNPIEFKVQEGDAHYRVGLDSNGDIYAEKYFFPRPGWSNCYGVTVNIVTSAKRAKASLEQWSNGWNEYGFGMDGSQIVNQKFIDLNEAKKLKEELQNIVNETDELEQEALALELAKKIIDLLDVIE